MEIKNELPPAHIWDRVKASVDTGDKEILFTYGEVIYNPSGVPVDDFLIHHEMQHIRQQRAHPRGADGWWEDWINDPAFRAEQECQGYGAQYKLYCQLRNDTTARAQYLAAISSAFASGLYGLTMSTADARTAILKRAGR